MRDFCENHNTNTSESVHELKEILIKAEQQNAWFTHDNLIFTLNWWGELLTKGNLENWIKNYALIQGKAPKTIGVVMAGNIPLVGFHDFLSVLLTGNRVLAKLSSNDTVLLPFFANYLVQQEPKLADSIQFVESTFDYFDAVIATGSNNTSRYFEYYFGKRPNIIRKNRNAVAVLTGEESNEELEALGKDIFLYFGLGCRNVSKIYLPSNYDFDKLFKAMFKYKDIIHINKYANNYDYNKAVYLMGGFKILDNGFLVLKEDDGFASPIASLLYSFYESPDQLKKELEEWKDDIQCIVSKGMFAHEVGFGQTQKPKLDDYADGVDTIKFLLEL